ncbi:Maf family protein [Alcanivorax jadensis]|jgi:septum formation protein|uniref:Maf family protein n=1 Tax=Alcanivorax jadensis TaxID=64988 RepID=UPI000C5D9A37|nr:nucleoside triphosphate pyrophosphatase [Alcanivorax jadensis]MBP21516.1 septum formation inhibitor Maf [Alcanivorax sp.]MDF1636630.1 Maf family protein [Alcanivorax jadensis]|tara:strand:- start:17929 stop:18516 length:588 start_codon:yes stop_codon:yes gene_type:complete
MILYLASGSPRRAELLRQIAVPFSVLPAPDIDETPLPQEPPLDYVCRMAREKAQVGAVAAHGQPLGAVLGADTAVVLGDEILGKPADKQQALAMLKALNGNEHQVMSALALSHRGQLEVRYAITRVQFRHLDEVYLQAYVDTGEGADKAGGYGIQGLGAALVASLTGSYSGVVGLPLEQMVELLDQVGIRYWQTN